jgi:hypothetical protein
MPVVGLRLPDIKPPPSPSEQNKRLISQMQDVTEEARIRRFSSTSRSLGSGAAAVGYKERTRSRPRGGSFGLDDFLNEPSTRHSGRSGGRQLRAARPTQRQPIDDETVVPVEVFESMLRAGQEARGRATHVKAFSPSDGRPFLRHHDAVASDPASTPCPMVVDEEPPIPASTSPSLLVLPSRPSSSCASEMVGERERWEPHEVVPLQVG